MTYEFHYAAVCSVIEKMVFCTVDTERAVDHATKMAGSKKLKKEQIKAIHSFLSGKDVLVALSTGYGKSFCYALLPAVFDHLH